MCWIPESSGAGSDCALVSTTDPSIAPVSAAVDATPATLLMNCLRLTPMAYAPVSLSAETQMLSWVLGIRCRRTSKRGERSVKTWRSPAAYPYISGRELLGQRTEDRFNHCSRFLTGARSTVWRSALNGVESVIVRAEFDVNRIRWRFSECDDSSWCFSRLGQDCSPRSKESNRPGCIETCRSCAST